MDRVLEQISFVFTKGDCVCHWRRARLATAYAAVGQVQEGLTVLAEALTVVDKTEERTCEAELYRLKGQLTLQQFQVPSFKLPIPNTQHLAPKRRWKPKCVF